MRLTKATWSKKYNVSRAAVTLAVKSGKLVDGHDGWLDDADPINAAWIARRPSKPQELQPEPEKKPRKRKEKPAPLPDPGADLPDDPPDLPDSTDQSDDYGSLSVDKIKAEIRYKTEAAEAYRIKRLERLGLLVERDHVRQTLGRFNAELRIRLLEMPGTITPRLYAMAKSGASEHEVIDLIETEIAKAIDHARATIDRANLGAK